MAGRTDVDFILDNFKYHEGQIYWSKTGTGRKMGEPLGFLDKPRKRLRTKVQGRKVFVHQIVWVLHYGEYPPEGYVIDHINRNALDNRIENLRLATPQENSWNRLSKNVYLEDGKYRVRVMKNGKHISFGRYEDPELAELVAEEARDLVCGEFNHA